MRVTFRLAGPDLLRLDGAAPRRRALADPRCHDLAAMVVEYRRHLGRDDRGAELLALGRRLFAWLDGPDAWLRAMLGNPAPPLQLDVECGDDSDAARAFLGAPWELLANDRGHLAASATLRFSVTRRLEPPGPPQPPPPYRLSVVFMAASPRDPHGRAAVLDFEAEETAILEATGEAGVDLVVEDSGDPLQLAERLAQVPDNQVLHLSCHGRAQPEPVLELEDDEANPRPTSAAELTEAIQAQLPRLLMLAACSTAQAGADVDGLATAMLRAGVPAVLGWDSSVGDPHATAFAAALYRQLGPRRDTVEQGVATARRTMLGNPALARDWHLARLWLRPDGGGVLVRPAAAPRWRADAEHGYRGFRDKAFLDPAREASPVASRAAFVGRRRELQRALRALRGVDHAGVLLRGMGRQGKSSLAARLAQRLADMTPVVVFGRYDALAIAEAVSAASAAAEELVRPLLARLPNEPALLERILREVLGGPCSERGTDRDRRALLLIVDDLERILEPDPGGGPHLVAPAHQPVMQALLRAVDPGRGASRLLLTSRYRFQLPGNSGDLTRGLLDLPLPPMPDADRRKLTRRHVERLGGKAHGLAFGANRELLARARELGLGNPGLQDRLVTLALEAPEAAAGAALAEMERFRASGERPGAPGLLELFQRLALEQLVGLATAADLAVLRGAGLVGLPVPLPVLARLGDPSRALSLGLLDGYEDIVDTSCAAAALNDLVRPFLAPLTAEETGAVAGLLCEPLYAAWGGSGHPRPVQLDVQLAQLAAAAGDAGVVAATSGRAVDWLQDRDRYRDARELGERSLAVLAEAAVEPPALLLVRLGEVLVTLGEPDRALPMLEQAKDALARDGDNRFAAIALGSIARLRAGKGEVDAALALHEEVIRVCEELGDPDGKANALWSIGEIHLAAQDIQKAAPGLLESYAINLKLGRLDGIAVVGVTAGQIMVALGRRDEGLAVLRRAAAGFRTLGREASVAQVEALIRRIEAGAG